MRLGRLGSTEERAGKQVWEGTSCGKRILISFLREEAEAPEWSLESMDQSGWFRRGYSYKAISRKLREQRS